MVQLQADDRYGNLIGPFSFKRMQQKKLFCYLIWKCVYALVCGFSLWAGRSQSNERQQANRMQAYASSKVTSHRNLFEASLICVVQYQCTLHTQQMQMNGVCALFACQAQLTCRQCTIFLIDLRDYNANSLTNSLGANASFVVLDILECCSYVAKSMAKYLRTATDANEYLAMWLN